MSSILSADHFHNEEAAYASVEEPGFGPMAQSAFIAERPKSMSAS
jgi:hypothetical protein